MDGIGRPWSRHQWSGTAENRAAIDTAEEPTVLPWNLIQWVADPGHDLRRARWAPSHPDPRGGFSGFGVPDSGGISWATGYKRDVPVALIGLDDLDAEGEVA